MSRRSTLIFALAVAAALPSARADATCASIAGKWHFYDLAVMSPAIHWANQQVVTNVGITAGVNPGDLPIILNTTKTIQIFNTTNGQPFNNSTGAAETCVLTIKPNGIGSMSCTRYAGGPHLSIKSAAAAVRFTLGATCELTGSVSIPGDPVPLVIPAGHINGITGGGLAYHGGDVHQFMLIKD